MKLHLRVSRSHDHLDDPKVSLFKFAQRLKVEEFGQNRVKSCKIVPEIWIRYFDTDIEFKFWIGNKDFENRLILSAKMKKSKIIIKNNISSRFVFHLETSKC
eukprot:UN20257